MERESDLQEQSQATPSPLPSVNTSKRKRTSRATSNQIDALLAKLEAQPFLATKRFTGLQGREVYETAWKEVAAELNLIINGSIKNSDQWITVWRDLKSRACAKAAKLNKERGQTGNRALSSLPLTEVERRIVSLVGVQYTLGTNCPDSMPDDVIVEGQYDFGVEDNNLVITNDQIETMPLQHQIPADIRVVDIPDPPSPRTETNTNEGNENLVRTRRNRNLNPRQSVAEQHNAARADFLAVAQSNAESMKMLAAASLQQAEAAKVQAEASMLFAEAANKLADALLILANKNT